MKFGTLTITNQYDGVSPCGSKIVKIDYLCDCGYKGLNKRMGCIRRQKMCLRCKNKNEFKVISEGRSAFRFLYHSYKKCAKERFYEFNLDENEFEKLTKQNCFYYGDVPKNIKKARNGKEEYIYNGIDRVDNNSGYSTQNVVACCKRCNILKMTSSINDFLGHIKKIYEHNFVENKNRNR